MSTDPAQAEISAPAPPGDSPRIRLARIAATAAGGHADVRALDPGAADRYCTFSHDGRIPGVVVVADGAPGVYAVSLYLHTRVVDLPRLAEEIRDRVRRAVDGQGMGAHLGATAVSITDVLADGDPT
jgi:hypothetical protein